MANAFRLVDWLAVRLLVPVVECESRGEICWKEYFMEDKEWSKWENVFDVN